MLRKFLFHKDGPEKAPVLPAAMDEAAAEDDWVELQAEAIAYEVGPNEAQESAEVVPAVAEVNNESKGYWFTRPFRFLSNKRSQESTLGASSVLEQESIESDIASGPLSGTALYHREEVGISPKVCSYALQVCEFPINKTQSSGPPSPAKSDSFDPMSVSVRPTLTALKSEQRSMDFRAALLRGLCERSFVGGSCLESKRKSCVPFRISSH